MFAHQQTIRNIFQILFRIFFCIVNRAYSSGSYNDKQIFFFFKQHTEIYSGFYFDTLRNPTNSKCKHNLKLMHLANLCYLFTMNTKEKKKDTDNLKQNILL